MAEALRTARVLALLCAHPGLIARFEDPLAAMIPADADQAALLSVLLDAAGEAPPPDAAALASRAGPALEALHARSYISAMPQLRPQADTDMVALCIAEDLAFLKARSAAQDEIAEAMTDLGDRPDERLTWRLAQAAAALERAARPLMDGAGTNEEDHASMSDHLQRLIDQEIWVKKPRKR